MARPVASLPRAAIEWPSRPRIVEGGVRRDATDTTAAYERGVGPMTFPPCDRSVATPHIGCATREAPGCVGIEAVDGALAALSGTAAEAVA